jgi:hypothetical protein
VAPRILDDASPLLTAAGRLLAPPVAPKLLSQLGPGVTALNQLEHSLPSLLSQVTPVSKCVQNGVVPVLDKPVDDGKLSTGQPVWQELVRYPVGLVSSAQNFSGNGYGVRYSFGLSEQLFGTNLTSPDNLVLLGSSPLVGARPTWIPGEQPPLAPNADCQTQPLTSLAATNTAAPAPNHVINASFARGWTVSDLTGKVSRRSRLLRDGGRRDEACGVRSPPEPRVDRRDLGADRAGGRDRLLHPPQRRAGAPVG